MVHDVVHAAQTCPGNMRELFEKPRCLQIIEIKTFSSPKIILVAHKQLLKFSLLEHKTWLQLWLSSPMTPLMASVMSLCLLASMKSSSLASMRNSVVSAHKCAPAEWPISTMLSYKTAKQDNNVCNNEHWVNAHQFSAAKHHYLYLLINHKQFKSVLLKLKNKYVCEFIHDMSLKWELKGSVYDIRAIIWQQMTICYVKILGVMVTLSREWSQPPSVCVL